MRRLFTGLMAVIAVTAVAEAAPNLEFSIGVCASKTDAKERLACYDAIAQHLRAGEAVPSAAVAAPPAPVIAAPVPAEPQPAPATPFAAVPPPAATPAAVQPEAAFGAENIKQDAREAAGQPAPLDEIHSVIKKLAFSPYGRAIVTLENGQVWRQIESDTDRFKGKEGDTATIARGLLGSYSLTVEGRSLLIKVQRVR